MSSPTKFPQVRESDLGIGDGAVSGDQLRALFRKLAAQLNPGLNDINRATSKGLSLSDNLRNDLVTVEFQHGVEQRIALTNLKQAASARVLSSESQIVSAVPVVRMVPLSQSGGKPMVAVTIHFNTPTNSDGTPTSSKVAIELLEEGIPSKDVPPWT